MISECSAGNEWDMGNECSVGDEYSVSVVWVTSAK